MEEDKPVSTCSSKLNMSILINGCHQCHVPLSEHKVNNLLQNRFQDVHPQLVLLLLGVRDALDGISDTGPWPTTWVGIFQGLQHLRTKMYIINTPDCAKSSREAYHGTWPCKVRTIAVMTEKKRGQKRHWPRFIGLDSPFIKPRTSSHKKSRPIRQDMHLKKPLSTQGLELSKF